MLRMSQLQKSRYLGLPSSVDWAAYGYDVMTPNPSDEAVCLLCHMRLRL